MERQYLSARIDRLSREIRDAYRSAPIDHEAIAELERYRSAAIAELGMEIPTRCPRCASLVTLWLVKVEIRTCLDCDLSWWLDEEAGEIVDDEPGQLIAAADTSAEEGEK